ncbi:type I secretion system permease/ATPase [Nisaea sp.]|uniref:type I secretion system permease/ATPase n=1 Tax=Nisaea sp. TaxID=2024842 RepID=UPI0032EE99E7
MKNEIRLALGTCKSAFAATTLFSFCINMLLFVPPIYMLQIYDRVLPSRSVSTLIMLSVLAAGLLLTIGMLEWVRTLVLVGTGTRIDRVLNRRIFTAVFHIGSRSNADALRDFDSVREFFTGAGFLAFLDAPWTPVFIGVCFMMHMWLGVLALCGSILLLLLAVSSEMLTRKTLGEAGQESIAVNSFVESSLRSSEAIHAMGMLPSVMDHWLNKRSRILVLKASASQWAGLLIAATKFFRMLLQSAILGLGAYLAIYNVISPGAMIAASIIMGRALAPVEMAVAQWRQFINARAAYDRLKNLLEAVPETPEAMWLPKPLGALEVDHIIAVPPGSRVAALKGVSFSLEPGEALGLIGPSAAGKSTLARVLVGGWPIASGKIRIDGSELQNWDHDQLGPHIGYLPQDVALLDGTVAENISRFGPIDPDGIVAAARHAGVHDIILRLPDGYGTRVGAGGCGLSGGQRQRIGLARALYGNPALVVLDEPNSNLDTSGDQALLAAMAYLRDCGTTVIVITHRTSVLAAVSKILVLTDGMVEHFGPRNEVLKLFAQSNCEPNRPATQRITEAVQGGTGIDGVQP